MRLNLSLKMPLHKNSSFQVQSKRLISGLLTCFLLLNVACKKEIDSPVVRSIGDVDLTEAELTLSTENANNKDRSVARSLYIEDWQKNASLYELAMQEEWEPDVKTLVLIEKAKRQIIVNQFLEHKLDGAEKKGKFSVDSLEVKQYYQTNQPEFIFKEPRYKLLRLYTSEKDSANELVKVFFRRNGEENAKERILTMAPDLTRLNEMAIARAEQFVPNSQLYLENESLRTLLSQMRSGTTSPVVQINDSLYTVMYLKESMSEGDQMSLEDAYEQIEQRISLSKQTVYLNELTKKARQVAK